MRSQLSWAWIAVAGGVVLSTCVALARGAQHPALAALGSTFWVAVGAALCWWHARAVEATRSAAADARAPLWPVVAPTLAGALPALGAGLLARSTGRSEAVALAAVLAAFAAWAAATAVRARTRRSPAGLRRALLVAGLPATALSLVAPAYGLAAGFSTPVLVLAVQGFTFGAIPGLWCAGAFRLGLRHSQPAPEARLGLRAGA